jgi:hypothetical protein
MDHTPQPNGVRNELSHRRFVLERDGAIGELGYGVRDARLILRHTEVPDAITGQGVGGQLVRAALAYAADKQLTVVPLCPFARAWIERHPDVAADVDIEWRAPPPS